MANALFALSDDKPVGTMTYLFGDRIKTKHIARIFAVYVKPDYRGQGIAKKLLDDALEQIRENKDVVKVQLMVNPKQKAAVTLYKSKGFTVVGELKRELKIGEEFYDEFVMEKVL